MTAPPLRKRIKILSVHEGGATEATVIASETIQSPTSKTPTNRSDADRFEVRYDARYGRSLSGGGGQLSGTKRRYYCLDLPTTPKIEEAAPEESMAEFEAKRRVADLVSDTTTPDAHTASRCIECGKVDWIPHLETGLLTCQSCGVVSNQQSESSSDYRPTFSDRVPVRTRSQPQPVDGKPNSIGIDSVLAVIIDRKDASDSRGRKRINRVIDRSQTAESTESTRVLKAEVTTLLGSGVVTEKRILGMTEVARAHIGTASAALPGAPTAADRMRNRALVGVRADIQKQEEKADSSTNSILALLKAVMLKNLDPCIDLIEGYVHRAYPSLPSAKLTPLVQAGKHVLARLTALGILQSVKPPQKMVLTIMFVARFHPEGQSTFKFTAAPFTDVGLDIQKLGAHLATMLIHRYLLMPMKDLTVPIIMTNTAALQRESIGVAGSELIRVDVSTAVLAIIAAQKYDSQFYATVESLSPKPRGP